MKRIEKMQIGVIGEQVAKQYLEFNGYEIVAQNYRHLQSKGEIDLLAVHENTLIVIEVKTRKRGSITSGADAVTEKKQAKLVEVLNLFLEDSDAYDNHDIRFDIINVTHGKEFEIEHLENAFEAYG